MNQDARGAFGTFAATRMHAGFAGGARCELQERAARGSQPRTGCRGVLTQLEERLKTVLTGPWGRRSGCTDVDGGGTTRYGRGGA